MHNIRSDTLLLDYSPGLVTRSVTPYCFESYLDNLFGLLTLTSLGSPSRVHLLILANPCCGPSSHGPNFAVNRKELYSFNLLLVLFVSSFRCIAAVAKLRYLLQFRVHYKTTYEKLVVFHL